MEAKELRIDYPTTPDRAVAQGTLQTQDTLSGESFSVERTIGVSYDVIRQILNGDASALDQATLKAKVIPSYVTNTLQRSLQEARDAEREAWENNGSMLAITNVNHVTTFSDTSGKSRPDRVYSRVSVANLPEFDSTRVVSVTDHPHESAWYNAAQLLYRKNTNKEGIRFTEDANDVSFTFSPEGTQISIYTPVYWDNRARGLIMSTQRVILDIDTSGHIIKETHMFPSSSFYNQVHADAQPAHVIEYGPDGQITKDELNSVMIGRTRVTQSSYPYFGRLRDEVSPTA